MKPHVLAPMPAPETDVACIDAGRSAPAAGGEVLAISQMAEKFGVTPRALRFYESKGLLAPAREGRGRIYTRADQEHLSLILKGRRLGFTIAEIGQMIAAEDGRASPQNLKMTREKCLEQIAHLERRLQSTTEALAELRRMHIALCRT